MKKNINKFTIIFVTIICTIIICEVYYSQDSKVKALTANLAMNSKRIPVLMYHSIDYEKNNELRIPKDKFREQMQCLKDNGFNTITLDELNSFIASNRQLPDKPIVITFDDGYSDNYTNAYPVLKEFGFKATIFMISGAIDSSSYLTSAQLQELDANGVDIESHTVSHRNLKELSINEQKNELANSKSTLEKILGRKIKYIAYPFGRYNEDTIKAIKDEGYDMAFTTAYGKAGTTDGIYTLKRIYISNNYSFDYYKKIVN